MDEDIVVNFGKKVRKLRKSKNLTQEQFAYMIEVDSSYIGKIERAERCVSLKTAEKIAHALDEKLTTLLDFS